jgi:hypothetical protein
MSVLTIIVNPLNSSKALVTPGAGGRRLACGYGYLGNQGYRLGSVNLQAKTGLY